MSSETTVIHSSQHKLVHPFKKESALKPFLGEQNSFTEIISVRIDKSSLKSVAHMCWDIFERDHFSLSAKNECIFQQSFLALDGLEQTTFRSRMSLFRTQE